MKKIILTIATIFSISSSYATLHIDACVKSHPAGTDCYELHITITDTHPTYGTVLVSSGDVWVGTSPCPPGIAQNPNSNCPNHQIGNQLFISDPGTPHCLQDILADPGNYANYEIARDAALNFGNNGFMKTTKDPQNSSVNNTASNKAVLSVSPNPTNNKSIVINTNVASKQSQLMMNVYDFNGKKVYNMDLKGREMAKIDLNLSQLASGTYQFVLSNNKNILSSQKVVFQ